MWRNNKIVAENRLLVKLANMELQRILNLFYVNIKGVQIELI